VRTRNPEPGQESWEFLSRPIFDRFPALASRVPIVPLATLPTPVERLPAAIAPDAWVKRDGLSHPCNGGSKIRALEFFLGEARAWGRPILAYGPEGSGWLLGLARFGPPAGLAVRMITFPQHPTPSTRHKSAMLRRAAGRRLEPARDYLLFALRALGHLPRVVGGTWEAAPPGGSDPISTLGYVNAALELAAQVDRGECPRPDAIYLPVGSGGAAAGLALGMGLLGWDTEVVGISIAPRLIASRTAVIRLAVQASWALDLKDVPLGRLRVLHRYAGSYAVPTPAGERALAHFGDHGILLDPVYTAKLGAAFLDLSKYRRAPLFWHTYAKPLDSND